MRSDRGRTFIGVRRHLTYANVMSTLAVFLVVAGGSALAVAVKRNSVSSKSIENNSVKSKDLKDGEAVGSSDVIDNSLTGNDIDESTLTVSPSGPAGGDLTGNYPNPTIGPDAIGSGNVRTDSLDETDLGPQSVTSSELGTIKRIESSVPISGNQEKTVISYCPAGWIALSGGGRGDVSGIVTESLSKENVAEAWVFQAKNTSGTQSTIHAFVYGLAP
jgi:hypothetical protein